MAFANDALGFLRERHIFEKKHRYMFLQFFQNLGEVDMNVNSTIFVACFVFTAGLTYAANSSISRNPVVEFINTFNSTFWGFDIRHEIEIELETQDVKITKLHPKIDKTYTDFRFNLRSMDIEKTCTVTRKVDENNMLDYGMAAFELECKAGSKCVELRDYLNPIRPIIPSSHSSIRLNFHPRNKAQGIQMIAEAEKLDAVCTDLFNHLKK